MPSEEYVFGWETSHACTISVIVTDNLYSCAPLLILFHNWTLWIPRTVNITLTADDWVLGVFWPAISDVSIRNSGVCSPALQNTIRNIVLKAFHWLLSLTHLQPTKVVSLHATILLCIWKGERPCWYGYDTTDRSRSKLLHIDVESPCL
jgi:hypothetical protein